MRNAEPLISFTFDDFPISALRGGGEILEKRNVRGTFYASMGLMGRMAPAGRMFGHEELKQVLSRGHELGCHTYDHNDAWSTPHNNLLRSIEKNQKAVERLFPGTKLRSFSYPISYPRPRAKREVGLRFESCRGGGQTGQSGSADLNLLKAFFLEKRRDDPAAVRRMIDWNTKQRGWLIFATHDVSPRPSPYGCTPSFFRDIVEYAVASGAYVLPVCEALGRLTEESKRGRK